MQKRSVMLLREFMAATTNHWTFLPLVFAFASVGSISPNALFAWFLVGMLPVILYVIREEIRSTILQFCCIPIAFGFLIFFRMESNLIKGVCLFFALIYVFVSLFMTMRQSHLLKILPPFFSLFINLGAVLIVFPRLEIYHYPFILFVSMILCGLSFFFAFYLDQYLIFIQRNEGTSNSMPKDKIFRSGMKANAVYLGIGSVLLLFISSFAITDEYIRNFWLWIREQIKRLIQQLLKLANPISHPDMNYEDTLSPMLPYFEERKASLLSQILEKILFFVVMLIVIAGFLYVIFKIFMFLRAFFPKRDVLETDEMIENLDFHESVFTRKNRLRNRVLDDDAIHQKIRRLFKKKTMEIIPKREELSLVTAREVADKAENPLLSEIYEKARYSNMSCSMEDWKSLRDSFRAHKKKAQ